MRSRELLARGLRIGWRGGNSNRRNNEDGAYRHFGSASIIPYPARLLNIQRHRIGVAAIGRHHHRNRRARKSGWHGAVDLIEPRVSRNPPCVGEIARLSSDRDRRLNARVVEAIGAGGGAEASEVKR